MKLESYESEVRSFINGIPTKTKIDEALKRIDYSMNVWQAESLTQIANVFQFYTEGTSLQEVIDDMTNKLK